jgi:formiminotetrahydrofolate cyclodeaminase
VADVAARQPAPGGGAVAAVTVAMAAGLVVMSARYTELDDAAEFAEEVDAERTAVLALADADAAAYGEVLAALRAPEGEPGRDQRIRAAWEQAADVPLRIARAGARVVQFGGALSTIGNQNLLGDMRAAVVLAEAATRAAAELVRINVEQGGLDPQIANAAGLAADFAAAGVRQFVPPV